MPAVGRGALLAVLTASTAHAGMRVIHDGSDAAGAIEMAAGATGLPPAELSGITLAELIGGGAPRASGLLALEPCTGTPTAMAQIRDAAARAQGDLNYGRFPKASTVLAGARFALGCLTDPVNAAIAARVFYLSAIVDFEAGDERQAHVDFHQAALLQPDITWDEAFAPDNGKALFDAAVARVAKDGTAALQVYPLPLGEAVVVDGKPAPADTLLVTLPAGRHLLQVGAPARTAWIELAASQDATLLFPADLSADALTWMDDPSRRTQVNTVLATLTSAGTPLVVVDGEHVWRGTTGLADWERLEQPGDKARRAIGHAVTWTGGALFVGGGGFAIAGMLRASGAIGSCEEAITANDPATCDSGVATYDSGRQWLRIGRYVAGAGLVLGGAGVTITLLDGVSATASPTGLLLQGRW